MIFSSNFTTDFRTPLILIILTINITIIFNVAFNQGHAHLVEGTMGFLPGSPQPVQCKTLWIVHSTVVGQNSISSQANLPVVTAESVILDSIARRASSIRCHPPQIASHMLCIKEIISSRKF